MPVPANPKPTACGGHDPRAAMARAEALARSRGLRLTPVRRRVLEMLLAEGRALGAYDVLDRLGDEGFGRQPPVAYRALDFLVEHGFAHRIRRLNAFAACAHPHEDHEAVFLICEACNALTEVPGAPIRSAIEAVARAAGFAVTATTVEALGRCATCDTTAREEGAPA